MRCVVGLFGGAARGDDDVGAGSSLLRRFISSTVAACNESNSPSLRCPTAFFKFLGRTCRGDAKLFTALATTREDEGGFSDGEAASRSDGCENRSGVVGRVRAVVIFRAQAMPNALQTALSRVHHIQRQCIVGVKGHRRFVESRIVQAARLDTEHVWKRLTHLRHSATNQVRCRKVRPHCVNGSVLKLILLSGR
jgi:hypothetical protein